MPSFCYIYIFFILLILLAYYYNRKYYNNKQIGKYLYSKYNIMLKLQILPLCLVILIKLQYLPVCIIGWVIGLIIGYVWFTLSFTSYKLNKMAYKIKKDGQWENLTVIEKRLYSLALMGGYEWHWPVAILVIIANIIGLINTLLKY